MWQCVNEIKNDKNVVLFKSQSGYEEGDDRGDTDGTDSHIFITPDQEKSRRKLHKMIVSHPHFKNINESWIKKTGHELNWFKHPLSAISGQIIWDGKKYVHQDSSKNTGWHLSFTDDIDGKLMIPRKFAS